MVVDGAVAEWIFAAQSGSFLPGGRSRSWAHPTRPHLTAFVSARSGPA